MCKDSCHPPGEFVTAPRVVGRFDGHRSSPESTARSKRYTHRMETPGSFRNQEEQDAWVIETLSGKDKYLWAVTEMECFVCNAEWIDVYPIGMKKSECPGCGYFVPMKEEEML